MGKIVRTHTQKRFCLAEWAPGWVGDSEVCKLGQGAVNFSKETLHGKVFMEFALDLKGQTRL